MSVWADDNDEWCGASLACDFGPKPCRSGVCLHHGRCMARDSEDAGQDTPAAPGVGASDAAPFGDKPPMKEGSNG
jgi:hypothetical protein